MPKWQEYHGAHRYDRGLDQLTCDECEAATELVLDTYSDAYEPIGLCKPCHADDVTRAHHESRAVQP